MKKHAFKIAGALLLTVGMILTVIPTPTLRADSVADTKFKMDKDKLVKYTGTDSSVSVPAGVKTIGQEAFADCTSMVNLTIPSGVEVIENGAFSGCKNLTKVIIPEGVEEIGSGAFAECTALNTVSLPHSLVTLGNGVFAGDTSLSSVGIAKNNEYFSTADGALYNDDKTVLYQVFAGRKGATYAMPNSVEDIKKYAFWGSKNIRQVALSSHLESVGDYSFSNASGLVTISLPFSCRSIGIKAFEDCRNLTDVLIPISVTRIDPTAFDGCFDINIIADDGTIAAKYFEDYKKNKELREEYEQSLSENAVNPHKIIDSDSSSTSSSSDSSDGNGVYVRDPRWRASDVDNYVEWDVDSPGVLGRSKVVSHRAVILYDSKDPAVYNGADGSVHGGGDITNEEEIVDASAAMLDSKILNRAFYLDKDLKNISIPADCSEIGDFAFARTGLKSVSIPGGVTTIGQGAFYHCDDLSSVSIPATVTKIEPDAFSHTAFINNWYNKAVDNSFLVVGDGILLAYKGVKANVTLPTAVKRIAPYAFKGHDELNEVSIPDSVVEIGEGAFENCYNLRNIAGMNKVTSIADRAFYNDPLMTIRIPASVKSIGQKAFGGNDITSTVVFMGDKIPEFTYEESATRLYNDDYRGSAFYNIEDAVVMNAIGEDDLKGTVLDVFNGAYKGAVYELKTVADESEANLVALSEKDRETADKIAAYGKTHKVKKGNGIIFPKENERTVSDNSLNGLLIVDHRGFRKNEVSVSSSGATTDTSGYHFYVSDVDDADKETLTKAIEDHYGKVSENNSFFMDLSMYDPTDTIPISKLGKSAVTLTMPVPASLLNHDFCVMSLDDNGLPDVTYCQYSKVDGRDYISFNVEHCSPYALYAADGELGDAITAKRSNPSGKAGLDDTPDTGDLIDPKIILAIGVITMGMALLLVGLFRKK